MKSKFDKLHIGIISAILAPLITIVVYYFMAFHYMSFGEFIREHTSRNIFGHIISLCVIPNLLLFFIYIWLNMLRAARGVIFSTLLYAFVVAGIRYL